MITSLQNPKVKQTFALQDRRSRNETGLFLIEGYRELSRAAKVEIVQLFVCPELFLGENEPTLIDQLQRRGAEIIPTDPKVFSRLSYRDRPDGLIGVARQMKRSLDSLEFKRTNPLFVIAESIEKPGNLGTILRSADAAGVDGVIVCDRCTDIYNPNVVRSSVGTLFTLPVIEAGSEETLAWLKANQIQVAATTPAAKELYTEVNLEGPVAIAVGTEQLGLSSLWMEAADIRIKIPMLGQADSLNVASATTLVLYEAIRQRRTHASHLR